MIRITALLMVMVAAATVGFQSLFAQELYLYGGSDHKVYLGCFTCSKFNSESIWNEYGTYGSEYNSKSIWNEYGTYGSVYNSLSPWNEYSSTPPVLVDKDGGFYGYFTRNKYKPQRTTVKFAVWVLDNYEWIKENFDEFLDELD